MPVEDFFWRSEGEQRIAIQRWIQMPVVIDFIDSFAAKNFLRNGFTAYNGLSPVNGLFATVAGGIASTSLTPAPRRRDHTSLPYASVPFVKGTSASTATRP